MMKTDEHFFSPEELALGHRLFNQQPESPWTAFCELRELFGGMSLERRQALHDAVAAERGVTFPRPRDEARAELRRFTYVSDSAASEAACLVLNEVEHLRRLLRDLIDFNMVEMEPDALCAVEGPRQIARHEAAWRAAIAEVGPRNERRFYGDEP